ncbi:MAG: hypothetical protein V7K40_31035 [Nostoc sp.]|uniref:hypothetical protein n=1 Tax=Nostoc sp. TaxID=1180 RepID=UPI002FF5E4A7
MAVCRFGAIAIKLALRNRRLFSAMSTTGYAYALSRKLVLVTLVTCNHRDLGKVPGLLIEVLTV